MVEYYMPDGKKCKCGMTDAILAASRGNDWWFDSICPLSIISHLLVKWHQSLRLVMECDSFVWQCHSDIMVVNGKDKVVLGTKDENPFKAIQLYWMQMVARDLKNKGQALYCNGRFARWHQKLGRFICISWEQLKDEILTGRD